MIYLDNSATTELASYVKQRMIDALEIYGNPSSTHTLGIEAKRALDNAREQVADALGADRRVGGSLFFTSCGSEANNAAILGCLYAKDRKRANKVITTDSEHPSVENIMKRLELDGFEVIRIRTLGGVLDTEQLASELDDRVALVSVMMVNNETGAGYDVKKTFSLVKQYCPNAVTHCDAVQGFLKIPFSVRSLGADMVSVSAHKIHGPKGVGALYVDQNVIRAKKLLPYIIGGGQESGYRSGTENVVGIVGFGAAAEQGKRELQSNSAKMVALRERCEMLAESIGIKVNVPIGARAPHILSLTLPNIKSETMLNFLSSNGICISAGSACSSHSRKMSAALLGFGLSAREADCTVRISFSEYNSDDDVDRLCAALKDGVERLVKIR